jgi:hypothetical protein
VAVQRVASAMILEAEFCMKGLQVIWSMLFVKPNIVINLGSGQQGVRLGVYAM